MLFQTYGIKYYGPHISMNRFDDQLVLSALRRVQLPERDDVYIYVESGFRLTQDNLGYSQYNGALSHLILDGEGNIVYSEIPEAMKVGENFSSLTADPAKDGYPGVSLVQGGFITEMERRFSHFAGSISAGENQWLLQILLVALFFLGFTVFLAWLLWKMVYKPLGLFHSEINGMSKTHKRRGTELAPKYPNLIFYSVNFRTCSIKLAISSRKCSRKKNSCRPGSGKAALSD